MVFIMNKKQVISEIKDQVTNVVYNMKGVTEFYSYEKNEKDPKLIILNDKNLTDVVIINWFSPTSVDITLNLGVSPEVTLTVTYNLMKNFINQSFKKISGIKLHELYLNVVNIKESK